MVKIALLLLLALPTQAFAFGPAIQAVLSTSSSAGVDSFCDSCPDAAAGADVFCEDCNTGAATGVCEWTKVEAGGDTGTISFAASPDNSPALGCTDIGMTYAVQVLKANTTAGATYAYKGFTEDALYIQFYIKIAAEGLADTDTAILMAINNGTDTSAWLMLYQQSGALRFTLLHYAGSGYTSDMGGTNVTADTWYGVRIYLNNPSGGGSDAIRWWVDYSNNGTWTEEGNYTSLTFNYTTTRFNIGHIENLSKTLSYFISGLKVDNDTMPTACTR